MERLANRLEVRLDPERRRKLRELADGRGVPVSDVVRESIDREYEVWLRGARMRAAEAIGQLAIETVPDPETLKRQLEDAYELPDLR